MEFCKQLLKGEKPQSQEESQLTYSQSRCFSFHLCQNSVFCCLLRAACNSCSILRDTHHDMWNGPLRKDKTPWICRRWLPPAWTAGPVHWWLHHHHRLPFRHDWKEQGGAGEATNGAVLAKCQPIYINDTKICFLCVTCWPMCAAALIIIEMKRLIFWVEAEDWLCSTECVQEVEPDKRESLQTWCTFLCLKEWDIWLRLYVSQSFCILMCSVVSLSIKWKRNA